MELFSINHLVDLEGCSIKLPWQMAGRIKIEQWRGEAQGMRIGILWRKNWLTLKNLGKWKCVTQFQTGMQSCMWLDPSLLVIYSYTFFWKSVFSTRDMLWELCTLWNIWVCYGKQHDALRNQTDYTKTQSDMVGTVDSWVCVKSLFQLLLLSCLRSWVTLPDHITIVFLTKAKQIKKIFRHEKKKGTLKRGISRFLCELQLECIFLHVMEQIYFSP